MQDIKTLKLLVKLMVDNELTELDLEDAGEKVRLRRKNGQPEVAYLPAEATGHAPAVAPAPIPISSDEPDEDDGLVPILSPMVGTFYSASSPDVDAFAKVGGSVSNDSVVCIIEAMKVFNEIKAELSGTIAKVLVANGQAVEFDQPLFLVKPS